MDPAPPGWIDTSGQSFDRRWRERLRRPDSGYSPIDDLAAIIDASRYSRESSRPDVSSFWPGLSTEHARLDPS